MKIDNVGDVLCLVSDWKRIHGEFPEKIPISVGELTSLIKHPTFNNTYNLRGCSEQYLRDKLIDEEIKLFGVKLTLYEEEGA